MNIMLTISAAKASSKLSKLLGKGGGGALPGVVADRIDAGLGKKLAAQIPGGIILVTGTNGKTTTTKLIADLLRAEGHIVLTNPSGSNLRQGVLSSLIAASDIKGNIHETIALFEIDEASLRRVSVDLQPKHILVLNLFRDQLDRYGELDTTAAMIGQGISDTQANVYLNADDPLVASLSKYVSDKSKIKYFGIDGLPSGQTGTHKTVVDSDRCPICGSRLTFSRIFYGHIGHYECPNDDYRRPQPSVTVTSVESSTENGTNFNVSLDGRRYPALMPLPGTYNLYNAVAAIALANGVGVDTKRAVTTLAEATAAYGRVEKIFMENKSVYLLLIKNPAGFTQVLDTFLVAKNKPHVLMLVNDNAADGRDVSWLWDVPLEAIAQSGAVIHTGGSRADDMTLRMIYAGCIVARTDHNVSVAVSNFLDSIPEGETGYILPTYTAMIEARKTLSKRTSLKKVEV